jgi:F0F1-type ATP synthase epsilon subunit
MADAQPIVQSNNIKTVNKESNRTIHVTVRNRTQILFADNVKSVTSRNDTGIFDILPEHSNFISLITSPLILGKTDGQKQEISFKNGLIKVKDNAVFCYIDLLSK